MIQIEISVMLSCTRILEGNQMVLALECTHKSVEKCHYTYVTEFTPVQEEICEENYEKIVKLLSKKCLLLKLSKNATDPLWKLVVKMPLREDSGSKDKNDNYQNMEVLILGKTQWTELKNFIWKMTTFWYSTWKIILGYFLTLGALMNFGPFFGDFWISCI